MSCLILYPSLQPFIDEVNKSKETLFRKQRLARNLLRVAIESGKGDESESARIVLKQVKWAYFSVYL